MANKSNKVVVEVFETVANSALAEASKKQSPLVPVDLVDLTAVSKVVEVFADGENDIFEGQQKIIRSAKSYSMLLGAEPTFEWFESNRKAWVSAYQALNPKVKPESVDTAFNRFYSVLNKEFGVEKPKSAGRSAKAMSEKRAKEKAHMEKLVDSQLHEAIAGFVQVGNFSEADKYQKEVKRREKLAGVDEEKALKLEIKLISRCLWKITDAKRIAEIRALIPNAVYDEVKADYDANVLKGQAIAK